MAEWRHVDGNPHGDPRRLCGRAVAFYADLYRYRELFLNLFRRDLQLQYKGSVLGVGWSLLYPLTLMAVYTVVFSVLWKAIDIHHYPLFVLSGLVTWIFFQSTLQRASTSLLAQASLLKQVRFPRQLLVLAVVATQIVPFAAMLAVLLVVNLIVLPETRSTFWIVFPFGLLAIALVSGLSLAVACANARFRDVEHLLGALFLGWFFLTPILYTFDALPGPRLLAEVIHWGNFVTPVTEGLRDALFFGHHPSLADTVYSIAAALAALALGAFLFIRTDDRLAAEL
jgi:homopolymeric O-antigen transport system permease protein